MEELANELHNKLHDLKSHFLDLDDLLWERDHEMYNKDPKMSSQLDSELDMSFRSLTKEVKHLNHLIKQYIDSEIITEKVALDFMKDESEKGESGRHPNGDISLTEVLDFLDENSSTREIKKHEKRVFSNAEMENAFLLDKHFALKGHERAGILYSGSGLEKSMKDAIGLSNFVSSFGKILDKRVIKGKPDQEIKRVMDTEINQDIPDDVDFELYQLPLSKHEQDMEAQKHKLLQHDDIVHNGEIVSASGKGSEHHHDEIMAKRLGKTINMQHGNQIIHEHLSHSSHEAIDLQSHLNDPNESESIDMYSQNLPTDNFSHHQTDNKLDDQHSIHTQSEILNMNHKELESHKNQSPNQSMDNLEIETPAKFVDKNSEGGQTVEVDNNPVDQLTEVVNQKKHLLSHKLTYNRKRNFHRKLNQKEKIRKLKHESGHTSAETSIESMDQIDQGLDPSSLDDSNHDHFQGISTKFEASPPSQDIEIEKNTHKVQEADLVSPEKDIQTPQNLNVDPESQHTILPDEVNHDEKSEISISSIDHVNQMNQDVDEDSVSPDHYQLRGKSYTKADVAQVNHEVDNYKRETPLDLAVDREKREKDNDSEIDSHELEEARLKKLEKLGYPKVERIDTHFDNPFNAYGIKRMDLTGSVKKFDGTPDVQETYHTLNKMFSLPYQDMKASLAENKQFQNSKMEGPDFVNIEGSSDRHSHKPLNHSSRSPISDLQKAQRKLSSNYSRRNKRAPSQERQLRVVFPSRYQRNNFGNQMMRGKIISDEPVYQKHSFLSQQDLMGYKRNLRPVSNLKNINQWHQKLMGGTEKMSKLGLKSQTDRIYDNMLRMRF